MSLINFCQECTGTVSYEEEDDDIEWLNGKRFLLLDFLLNGDVSRMLGGCSCRGDENISY